MTESALTEAFAVCEIIAEDRARATAHNEYAEGYRCAAGDIAAAIRAKRQGREPTPLERDLRDAEVEARTLARVVSTANRVIETIDPQTSPGEAIRALLHCFFDADDLPPNLRRQLPCESTTRLVVRDEDIARASLDVRRRFGG